MLTDARNTIEFTSFDEKDTILEIPQIGGSRSSTYAPTHITMNILKKINLGCSILLFGLAVLLLTDTLLYNEEIKRIPLSCFDKGECTFGMKTPTGKGKQLVYLGFNDFNQNYRDYQDSVSLDQLFGQNVTKAQAAEDCEMFLTNSDLHKTRTFGGSSTISKELANPCGLIAYTYPEGK